MGFRLLVSLAAAAVLACAADPFVIRDVRVFDGAKLLPPVTVVVAGGLIREVGAAVNVPAGAATVDGSGKTLLPGLIDAHVHITAPGDLKRALSFGVTTYLDMFTVARMAAEIRTAQAAGRLVDHADLRSAGTLLTAPGGHGTEYGVPIPTLSKPEDARTFVDARIAEGSDYIKLIKDDGSAFGFHRPTLDRATLAAGIAAAHARGKRAVVHIATLADAREAIACGADVLAHTYAGEADPEIAREAAAHHVAWTPTLAVTAQKNPAAAIAMVRAMKAADVTILAGTDAPNPGTSHGSSLHEELALLVKAGLTPVEALAAATSAPAATFRLADRGRIAPGMRADLVLVDGDPTRDIAATRKIVAIWKLGERAAATTAITASAAVPPPVASASGHPDFSGTWKLTDQESEITFVIEHKDPVFRYTANGYRGLTPVSESFEFTTGGRAPADPSTLGVVGTWEGSAVVMHFMKDGKELTSFTFRLSADGRQLLREGGPRNSREVYNRQ